MQLSYLDQQLDQKRQIKLKTCADVYNYWRRYKRHYKKAPKDGVEFQIEYIDTGLALPEELRSTAPIALALHGAPGSYHDFALLIQHLTKQNVRVIAPNFPEYAATVKTKVLFRHSADEKAAYLRDFLKAIQEAIERQRKQKESAAPSAAENQSTTKGEEEEDNCDSNNNKNNTCNECKSHSQQPTNQQHPTSQLISNNRSTIKATCRRSKRRTAAAGEAATDEEGVIVKFDEPIEIKAVALFNPAGHRLPKSMKPTWFKCGSVRIYQHKLGRSLFGKLGPAFLTVVGVPVRVDNMDNVMLSATVMRNSRCHRVVDQLQRLAQMRLPTLLVFSENDKLIEKEIFYEMTNFMKLERDNFNVYEGENEAQLRKVQQEPANQQDRDENWVRVMVFKDGGHYTYSNYSKIVNEAVSDLLAQVTTKTTAPNSNNNNNDVDEDK